MESRFVFVLVLLCHTVFQRIFCMPVLRYIAQNLFVTHIEIISFLMLFCTLNQMSFSVRTDYVRPGVICKNICFPGTKVFKSLHIVNSLISWYTKFLLFQTPSFNFSLIRYISSKVKNPSLRSSFRCESIAVYANVSSK